MVVCGGAWSLHIRTSYHDQCHGCHLLLRGRHLQFGSVRIIWSLRAFGLRVNEYVVVRRSERCVLHIWHAVCAQKSGSVALKCAARQWTPLLSNRFIIHVHLGKVSVVVVVGNLGKFRFEPLGQAQVQLRSVPMPA